MDSVTPWLQQMQVRGLENVIGRYYGMYLCEVTKNNDPKKRGRIKVRGYVFPLTMPSGELETWIIPKMPFTGEAEGDTGYGIFFPPEVGSHVLVSFIEGDFQRPVYDGGVWLPGYEDPPYMKDQTLHPTVRGIKTRTGHEITFSEKHPEEGATKEFIKVRTAKGNMLLLDDSKGEITLVDVNGNKYFSNKDGVTMTVVKDLVINVQNNATINVQNDCKIKASGDCDISASSCTIDADDVTITGGNLTVDGTVTPSMTGGPFNCLSSCVLSGAPHRGSKVTGT